MRKNAQTEEQMEMQQNYVENSRGMYNMMQNQNVMEVQDNLQEVQQQAQMVKSSSSGMINGGH